MSDYGGKMPADVSGDATGFYARLGELLACGERLALCTVLRLAGSGPRQAGAKMLVWEGGQSVGTIGGGVLEKQATAWAQEVLRTGRALCRSFALDLTQASEEGMTCGGEVEVLVEHLDGATPSVRDFFAQVLAVLMRGERGWLGTVISQEGEDVVTSRLLVVGGRSVASLPASAHSLPEELLHAPSPSVPLLVERETGRYFLEPLAPPITVYIFGGGHIGAHLVPLCHLLGFRTVVVDDRADFATPKRFPQASELVVAPSFDHALEDLAIGGDGYVVIITRGHGGDEAILRQALRRRPGYIGMIGSQRKRALVFQQLASEGVTSEELARVACPIGVSIGAETPEEIALSIAAELIATRAARRGKG